MRTASRGMSIIDAVIGIALMLIVFLALFGMLRASVALSTLARAKAIALELASSQMEYLRGLPYESLGTVGGTPSGLVPNVATSTMQGAPYIVRTTIIYYDEPADGVGDSDENAVTRDYKKGSVAVTYVVSGRTYAVTLLSNFAPEGIETS